MIQVKSTTSTKELSENTSDQDWLEGDISSLGEYELYDWNNCDPLKLGKPVKYVPDIGFIVEGGKDNV